MRSHKKILQFVASHLWLLFAKRDSRLKWVNQVNKERNRNVERNKAVFFHFLIEIEFLNNNKFENRM